MGLYKAINREQIRAFINKREIILLIDMKESNTVEVLLAIKYNEISNLQDLLPKDFLDNHGIAGEANGAHFYARINEILEWMDLSIEDFMDQLAEQDRSHYEKWKHMQSEKSA